MCKSEIGTILEKLTQLCPQGYAIALHINFTTPKYLFQSYRKDWSDYYSKKGWVMHDPTVQWGFENTGVTSWESLIPADKYGIFAEAAKYGLKFGFVCAIRSFDSSSFSSFAREDRNYCEAEISQICKLVNILHDMTLNPENLSETEIEHLNQLTSAMPAGNS